jgi:hypothetical protein
MLATARHRTVSAHSVWIPLFVQNHITGSFASVTNYRPSLRTWFSCPIVLENIGKLERSRKQNLVHQRLILEGTMEAVATLNIGLAEDEETSRSRQG